MNNHHYKYLTIVSLFGSCIFLSGCMSSAKYASESFCDDEIQGTVEAKGNLKLLSLNMAHGRQTAFNQLFVSDNKRQENLQDIANQIQQSSADIVALQEADAPSRWSGKFNHVEYLRDSTGHQCAMQGHHADTWLFTYGAALLTRIRSYGQRSIRFDPTPPTTTKGFVKVIVDWNFNGEITPVTVVSVHLDFASKTARTGQVQQLVNELQNTDTPLVIMGDLNSHWNQRNSHVRMLSDRLGVQAYNAEDESLGTFRSEDGRRLDWILISKELMFTDYRVLTERVSDHLAIYAEIGHRGPLQLARYDN